MWPTLHSLVCYIVTAVTIAVVAAIFFCVTQSNESDNEDTYLDQVRICNVHWHFYVPLRSLLDECHRHSATSFLSSGGLVPPKPEGRPPFMYSAFPHHYYILRTFVRQYFFLATMCTSASIGLLNDVTTMIPAASAIASPIAACPFTINCGMSRRRAASIA